MADLTGLPGLQQSFQCAARGDDGLQILGAGVVNLVQVNVVGAQVFQTDVNVCGHGFLGAGHALGGQHKLVPDALQTVANVLFADGIAPGSVDIVHSGRHQLLQQLLRTLCIDALNGNAAKTHGGNLQAGAAQCSVFHSKTLPVFFVIISQMDPNGNTGSAVDTGKVGKDKYSLASWQDSYR